MLRHPEHLSALAAPPCRSRDRIAIAAALALAGPASLPSALGQIVLTDVTTESGLLGVHQLHGPGYFGMDEQHVGGLAVGDFNRNGWPDLFVLGGGGVEDQLWINQGDGTFLNEALAWGVAVKHCGAGVAVIDFDGDGWLDLFVTSYGMNSSGGQTGRNRLYRNTGSGTFEEIAFFAGVRFSSFSLPGATGVAVGDYDLDGRLDVFISNWRPNALGNRLFRNMGDGTFLDQIVPSGLQASGGWWFQGAFADMTGDGWPDLLVAGDFGTSGYFRNNRDGTFTDVTAASGSGLDAFGMGQAIADLDGDGRLDWYVTSIHVDPPLPGKLSGNTLYLASGEADGHPIFEQVAEKRGVDDGAWGWGTVAVDLDNDGWVDLVEVNGWDTGMAYIGKPGRVFRNLGHGFFEDVASESGFGAAGNHRTVVWWDYDRDGRIDLVVQESNGAIRLYRNESPTSGRWLQVAFDTSTHPLMAPDGFGARVEVHAGKRVWVGLMTGSPGYLGTSEPILHFGLGAIDAIDEIVVRWPRGVEQRLVGVALDTRLELVAPRLGDLDGDGVVGAADLARLLAAWGVVEDLAGLAGDLDGDGVVDAADLSILLSQWGSPR